MDTRSALLLAVLTALLAGSASASAEEAPSCPAGTREEVLACLKRECATRLHDSTPKSLAKLGHRLIICDHAPPEGATATEPKGRVWLYRADKRGLTRAAEITVLGASAKYYSDDQFSFVSAEERSVGGRQVLRVTWRLTGTVCGGAMCGCHHGDSTRATFCLREGEPDKACPVTVPVHVKHRFEPSPSCPGEPAYTDERRYTVELKRDGVLVTATETSGKAGDPKDPALGLHPLTPP